MDLFVNILGACSTITSQKAKAKTLDDEVASEIQLNAFEFRNYRTSLDAAQQQVLERIVNQWCSMLVRGRTMKVEGIDDKVYLDKDLLTLEYLQEPYPLKAISRMSMSKDVDEMMTGASAPFGLEITFEGGMGDVILKFNFEQERQRLHFALTLRILRTRDPTLDPSSNVVVDARDEDEEDEVQTFNQLVHAQHYNVDAGIPIVFSVSDLKLFHKLQSSSRHTYLEFFVRYPRQDRFLYAKSPTTHLPQQVLQTDDAALRRKKEKKEEADDDEEKKKEELKRQVLGDEVPICAMRFELKNVKLRVPKVPHQIFGRLMAKDDYFPTAIGTFDFQVNRSHLQNKLKDMDEHKKKGANASKKEKELPETMRIPMYSSWKVPSDDNKGETYLKIGTLTIRLMGYVTDPARVGDGAARGARQQEDSELKPLADGSASGKEEGDDAEAKSKEGERDEDRDGKQRKDSGEDSSSSASSSSSSS